MTIFVCSEPHETIYESPHGGARWCFHCCKRVGFVLTVRRPVDPMSYYGPYSDIHCEHGHSNGDLFPGRWREWE